ncbi:MAG: alpha/beta hydrolase, partial [Bacteroidales bacterium]|nr:alpha/beta hydrolase [Bacteroidales bacterium]
MKKNMLFIAATFCILSSCGTQQQSQSENITLPENQIVLENGGSGDFKAVMFEDSSLSAHTIFCPKDLSKFSKSNPLPILVWGNGACNNSPHEHILFLNEIASHGYVVIATGYMPHDTVIYKGPMSKSQQQIESIDWAIKQNGDKNSYFFDKLDTKNIAAAGMSCGGLQTLFNCADKRLKTIMICNSGLFINPVEALPDMPMPEKSKLEEIHTP